jgi:hypothetical protein
MTRRALFLAIAGIALLGVSVSDGRAAESDVPEVRLGHGSIGNYRWAVFAGRESQSGSPRRPCITVASAGAPGADTSIAPTVCGAVVFLPTLLSSSENVGKRMRTVLGMAFAPKVRSVRLWLRGRGSRLIRLKRLSARQSAKAGLMRFRYAARAFAGTFCLQRFAYYDAAGDLIELTPHMGCPHLPAR